MLISSPWISKGLSATSLSYPRWRFILQMMWSVGQLKRLKKAITIPVNTKHVYNIYTMSGQRRSRTLAIFTKKLCDKNYGKELMSDIFTRNEMNGVLGHLSAHIGQTGAGEPSEDGEMNEVTLPSRHMIRNSSPGRLTPSTLPLGHGGSSQYWIFTSERGRNILFLWNLKARVEFEHAISDFPSLEL